MTPPQRSQISMVQLPSRDGRRDKEGEEEVEVREEKRSKGGGRRWMRFDGRIREITIMWYLGAADPNVGKKMGQWALPVVLSLLILSFLGAISLQHLFIIGLPIAFIVFFVYEKKEEEIDHLVSKILSLGCKLKSDVKKIQ
ncbi:hypothetical protein Vadar_008702 [Vaccinium darrowii]|uniref:Uncharacterized protein n=1 Tax=Vaccinium darrowii TaxID=229202 RepID=A0ACB7YKE8_9ERIC|nr:hypothetical protein Vadar_008702 [Vaccinium darrowii]